MVSTTPTRNYLLLVTFDLPNPVPGDPRYRNIDRYLGSLGTVIRPLKQTRLVITSAPADAVVLGIRTHIGIRGGVAAIRVSRRSRTYLADPAMRMTIRRAIRQYGTP